jgi:hypothetical protein
MATELEKLSHELNMSVQNHALRKASRERLVEAARQHCFSELNETTEKANRDQANEDASLENHLTNLNSLIAIAKAKEVA